MVRYEVAYYREPSGTSPIEDFLDSIPVKAAAKCVKYIDLLEEQGFALPGQYSKKVEGDVWELRPEFGGVEYRLLYGRVENRFFLIAHAITKKGRKLNRGDIDLAQSRLEEVQAYYAGTKRQAPSPLRRRTD